MKRMAFHWIMVLLVGLFMTAAASAAEMSKPAKGKEVSISGKMTCTFCNLSQSGKPCQPGCCERCIKAGDPPLLTDGKGNQFILLTGEHEVPLMTAERFKLVGQMVTVRGILVKGKGVQAVYVDTMKKKEEKKNR